MMIRNFSIIAHIDHGKSTLADRFLELTGVLTVNDHLEQYLDNHPVSRRRGVTIRMATVAMKYKKFSNGATEEYILNLIDTPGHLDFSYEVSRALKACEGAILLVDATKGIQAQTVAHFERAKKENLIIIPTINKIDLPSAEVAKVARQMSASFGFRPSEILKVSAKTGEGILDLLSEVIIKIPPPPSFSEENFRAMIFNSYYDPFRGVVAVVKIVGGDITTQDIKNKKLYLLNSRIEFEPSEMGVFCPQPRKTASLRCGEVGFLATGVKNIDEIGTGDTICFATDKGKTDFFPGYISPKPMVFLGIYPQKLNEYPLLEDAFNKLKLNDASLVFEHESNSILGQGLRVGFLGMFHAEIVQERIKEDFRLEVITTRPSVAYKFYLKDRVQIITRPQDMEPEFLKVEEPYVEVIILSPAKFLGRILEGTYDFRAKVSDINYLGLEVVKIILTMPLAEMVTSFQGFLKTVSQGFASLDYEPKGFSKVEAVLLKILINREVIDPFTQILPKEKAVRMGKLMVSKLQEILPRQQFALPIQAVVGNQIVARADLPSFRKDVLAKLSGGDYTRKLKLLEKQKRGKKKMRQFGTVAIPKEVFWQMVDI